MESCPFLTRASTPDTVHSGEIRQTNRSEQFGEITILIEQCKLFVNLKLDDRPQKYSGLRMADNGIPDDQTRWQTNSVIQMFADYTQPEPRVKIHGRYYHVVPGAGLSISGCPQVSRRRSGR